jgi:hypothetical protein
LSLSWICCPSRAPRPWMDPGASGGWMPGSGSGRCCYWRGGGPLGVPGTWGVTARPLRGARASWFGAGWHWWFLVDMVWPCAWRVHGMTGECLSACRQVRQVGLDTF